MIIAIILGVILFLIAYLIWDDIITTSDQFYKPEIVYLPIKGVYMVRYGEMCSGDGYLYTHYTTGFINYSYIERGEQFETKEEAELYKQKFLEQKTPIVLC